MQWAGIRSSLYLINTSTAQVRTAVKTATVKPICSVRELEQGTGRADVRPVAERGQLYRKMIHVAKMTDYRTPPNLPILRFSLLRCGDHQ